MTKVRSQLLAEAKIYRQIQGGIGIPCIYWSGTEGEFNIMAIELLGANLEELLTFCGHKLSVPTVLSLSEQLVRLRSCEHYVDKQDRVLSR